MYEPNWPGRHENSPTLGLARLEGKLDSQTQILLHLVRLNETAITASRTSTPAGNRTSGPRRSRPLPPRPLTPPQGHTDESLLMTVLRHFAPKALMWAAGRLFSLALQFLLPTLVLAWALTQKGLGTVWQLLLGALS